MHTKMKAYGMPRMIWRSEYAPASKFVCGGHYGSPQNSRIKRALRRVHKRLARIAAREDIRAETGFAGFETRYDFS